MIDREELPAGGSGTAGQRLNAFLAQIGLTKLDAALAGRFEEYLALILRWNSRMNLTAIRDEEGIISRHFVESIACANAVPEGVSTLLDFGSGAGFPGIPIGLCRPEISLTLAESQNKKAAFLREAVRTLGLPAKVYTGRAETLSQNFDCVTLRAVDRMANAVTAACGLVGPSGWIILLTTGAELSSVQKAAEGEFAWLPPVEISGSAHRVIVAGQKSGR